jgi:hypothetical protein
MLLVLGYICKNSAKNDAKKRTATLLPPNVGHRQVCCHIGALHAFHVFPLKSQRERQRDEREEGEEIGEERKKREWERKGLGSMIEVQDKDQN